MAKKKPRVISLFAGCGGLDLGFIRSGYKVVWANDNMADAVETYRKNIGNHIELGDIKETDLESLPECDIVIGGPPCQSFSLVGKRDRKDPRGNLVWDFYETVKEKKPKMFLMENVTGLAAAKDKKGVPVLDYLKEQFGKLGYTVNHFILNSADYGVPQRRRRIFIVGHKNGKTVTAPKPTHMPEEKQRTLFDTMPKWVSTYEALDDLTLPKDDDDEGAYTKKPECEYQKMMREANGKKFKNHQMPYMSETDLKIIKAVPIGGNYMDVPDEIATKRIMNFKKTGGRTTTYGRMRPEDPAYTLNTHFSRPNVGCNIHYGQDRLITIREGLRLQSFPDDFIILHNSKRSAYTQVGNAVPPLLAEALAKHIKKYF